MSFSGPVNHPGHTGGFDILSRSIAHGAAYNAAGRFPAAQCHPQTRSTVLSDLSEWVDGGKSRVLWLSGSLGCGKTVIAQTIAERCEKSGKLASSFFFARESEERANAQVLFASIAAQLAVVFPESRGILEGEVEVDPLLLSKSLQIQFEKMMIGPFGHIDRPLRNLIIIDALDECKDEEAQCRILRLIVSSAEHQRLPFHFLICTRPEPHIRQILDQELSHFCRKIDLDTCAVDADIALYFRDSFKRITKFDHSSPHTWPGEDALSKLVIQASGQFLYASLIVRSVDDPYWYPSDKLKLALGYEASGPETFATLDKLYTHVLSRDPQRERLLQILGAILLLCEPPYLTFLVRLLSLGSGEISLSLRLLQSVLQMTPNSPIRVRHQSFIDFLLNRARSGPFHIEAAVHHSRIARYCLRVAKDANDAEHAFGLNYWCYHISKSDDEELLNGLPTSTLAQWIDCSARQNPKQDDFPLIANRLQEADLSLYDGFIRMILQHCCNREALLQILGILAISRRPLMLSEVVGITSIPQDIVSVTLCQVNPLVHISSPFLDSQWGIRFGSFSSFLTMRRRSGDFFVDIDAQHTYLTLRCFEALKDEESTPATFFALENWTFHLSRCPSSRKILAQLKTVSTENATRQIEVDRILGWLMKFRIPPRDTIKRWQTHRHLLLSTGIERTWTPPQHPR